MKNIVLFDSLKAVKEKFNTFDPKKTYFLTLDISASEYLKTEGAKNYSNIFDLFSKEERLKIFFQSIKDLEKKLQILDKKYSKQLSRALGEKNLKFFYLSFKNLLFYEYFSHVFIQKSVNKILKKKKFKNVYYINDQKINTSKVFKLNQTIQDTLKKNKKKYKIIYLKFKDFSPKVIFVSLVTLFLNLGIIFDKIIKKSCLIFFNIKKKERKQCLFFFEDYKFHQFFNEKKFQIINLKKIEKKNLKNEEKKIINKLKFFFHKKSKNGIFETSLINYLVLNLELYLTPLIKFKKLKKNFNNLKFSFWSRPVVNYPGYNLILEFLLKKNIPVIGRQHGACYIDLLSLNQHYDMDFKRCNYWLSFAADNKKFSKTYSKFIKPCEILPSGSNFSVIKKTKRKEIDILFPIQPMSPVSNLRPIDKEIYSNQKIILKTLDYQNKFKVMIKPPIRSNYISDFHSNLSRKSFIINNYYSLKKTLKIYKPKLVILEYYSTPLYDVIDDDCDIFLINETVEKIPVHVKNDLKKRVYLFDNVKELSRAIKRYKFKEKTRDTKFYQNFVNNGSIDKSLLKIQEAENIF